MDWDTENNLWDTEVFKWPLMQHTPKEKVFQL